MDEEFIMSALRQIANNEDGPIVINWDFDIFEMVLILEALVMLSEDPDQDGIVMPMEIMEKLAKLYEKMASKVKDILFEVNASNLIEEINNEL